MKLLAQNVKEILEVKTGKDFLDRAPLAQETIAKTTIRTASNVEASSQQGKQPTEGSMYGVKESLCLLFL